MTSSKTRPDPRRSASSVGSRAALAVVALLTTLLVAPAAQVAHAETLPPDFGPFCETNDVQFRLVDGTSFRAAPDGIVVPVDFDPIDDADLTSGTTATLTTTDGTEVPGTLTHDADVGVLIWMPDAPLASGEYTLTLSLGESFRDPDGCRMPGDLVVTYPIVVDMAPIDPATTMTPSLELTLLHNTTTECCPGTAVCWTLAGDRVLDANAAVELGPEAPPWYVLEIGLDLEATTETRRVIPDSRQFATDAIAEPFPAQVCASYALVNLFDASRIELAPVCLAVSDADEPTPRPVDEMPANCEEVVTEDDDGDGDDCACRSLRRAGNRAPGPLGVSLLLALAVVGARRLR